MFENVKKHKLYNTGYGFLIYWMLIATLLYITIFMTPGLNKFMNNCSYKCSGKTCKQVLNINPRGKGYFIDTVGDSESIPDNADYLLANCLITRWSISHFIVHFFGGMLFPDWFVYSFIGGVAFEYYENKQYDCHDGLDIVMNSSGFITGALVNKYLIK